MILSKRVIHPFEAGPLLRHPLSSRREVGPLPEMKHGKRVWAQRPRTRPDTGCRPLPGVPPNSERAPLLLTL